MELAKIDREINNLENFLSKCAALPVIGVAPGAIKFGLGGSQLVLAIGLGILSSCYGLYSKDMRLFKFSCSHICHGLGNLFGGFLEAIPLVGTGLYLIRLRLKTPSITESTEGYIDNGHQDKFLSYASLVEKDLKFLKLDDSQDTYLDTYGQFPLIEDSFPTTLYQNKLKNPGNASKDKLTLAKEAFNEASFQRAQENPLCDNYHTFYEESYSYNQPASASGIIFLAPSGRLAFAKDLSNQKDLEAHFSYLKETSYKILANITQGTHYHTQFFQSIEMSLN